MTTITALADLSRKHPLEIEAEQLGALAAWCELRAWQDCGVEAWLDFTNYATWCRHEQMALIAELARLEDGNGVD